MTNQSDGTRTPGVYVTELAAFPPAVVGVETAVPVFVGYTEYAGDPANGAALYGKPVQIASLVDYQLHFGGPPSRRYRIVPAPVPLLPGVTPDFIASTTSPTDDGWAVASGGYLLEAAECGQFLLYRQMQLFFDNGGGNCQIVSAGSYWANQAPVSAPGPGDWTPGSVSPAALSAGLAAAEPLTGPTMIVIPEACQLGQADYATIAAAMLAQAGTLQDRMAILDPPSCLTATGIDALTVCQANLWAALATPAANLSYGAAYAPALNATLVQASDLDFTCLASADNTLLNDVLTTQAHGLYWQPQQLAPIQAAIASAFPLPATLPKQNTPQYSGDSSACSASGPSALNAMLVNALPLYGQLLALAAKQINLQPPSGALAGVWARNDGNNGVWQAPANISLVSVASPLFAMNDAQQGGFNVPDNGMAIDIIRAQPGRGSVVWGARTLDGNSNDFRYIQVRRTLIYIEQSIKAALQPFVFAANDTQTWSSVTAMVSSFLTQLWSEGGLQGAKASDAFSVACGVGSTMTGQDVLEGNLIVSAMVAITHPAEFIVLTVTQQMSNTNN